MSEIELTKNKIGLKEFRDIAKREHIMITRCDRDYYQIWLDSTYVSNKLVWLASPLIQEAMGAGTLWHLTYAQTRKLGWSVKNLLATNSAAVTKATKMEN